MRLESSMIIGQLGQEKMDLIRALKHLAALLMDTESTIAGVEVKL